MLNTQDFTKLFPLDASAATDAWKSWATFGERFAGITLNAATKSTEIATASTHETLARLRDVTTVRDEPADYAKALNEFAQAQVELSRRTAEAFGGVAKEAQTDTADLVTSASERFAEQSTETAKTAADKTATKAKQVSKAAK